VKEEDNAKGPVPVASTMTIAEMISVEILVAKLRMVQLEDKQMVLIGTIMKTDLVEATAGQVIMQTSVLREVKSTPMMAQLEAQLEAREL